MKKLAAKKEMKTIEASGMVSYLNTLFIVHIVKCGVLVIKSHCHLEEMKTSMLF